MSNLSIALDAGHGGSDSGAVYENRKEKDDVLKLTRAVGQILENSGINVFYVRSNDEYETPFKKATDANNNGADYFVSIHRNSSERPNQYSGVETLVYGKGGIRSVMAENINEELEKAGFKNLGITERPNLVVLKRTQMPAVLVEVGFINNDDDNRVFDENFNEIAQGIADGILKTLYSQDVNFNEVPNEYMTNDENQISDDMPQNMPLGEPRSIPQNMSFNEPRSMPQNTSLGEPISTPQNMPFGEPRSMPQNIPQNMSWSSQNNTQPNTWNPQSNSPANTPMPVPQDFTSGDTPQMLYRVQVGSYRDRSNAERMLNALLMEGFPAFMIYENNLYKVQVGAFRYLFNAIKMERRLRRFRYNTYIVYS